MCSSVISIHIVLHIRNKQSARRDADPHPDAGSGVPDRRGVPAFWCMPVALPVGGSGPARWGLLGLLYRQNGWIRVSFGSGLSGGWTAISTECVGWSAPDPAGHKRSGEARLRGFLHHSHASAFVVFVVQRHRCI